MLKTCGFDGCTKLREIVLKCHFCPFVVRITICFLDLDDIIGDVNVFIVKFVSNKNEEVRIRMMGVQRLA